MRIIISPAKQMKVDTDSFEPTSTPVFVDRAEVLKDWIQVLSYVMALMQIHSSPVTSTSGLTSSRCSLSMRSCLRSLSCGAATFSPM